MSQLNYYHYCYTRLTASIPGNLVIQYQNGEASLDLNEARDDGVSGCSGIRWTICKHSAPHSRQITTRTPHHSVFTGRVLFLMPNQQCQSTEGSLSSSSSSSSSSSFICIINKKTCTIQWLPFKQHQQVPYYYHF